MIHRRDAEGAEKKFIYKNLCGLCVSAVRYKCGLIPLLIFEMKILQKIFKPLPRFL